MWKYETTHPWIKFQFDTRRLNHKIWLRLGEAKSKCEHILGAPLLPETIRHFSRIYLVKGVLATTAIEGNTLTENEVDKRINGELNLPPSKEYLGLEIDNIVEAVNMIGDTILNEKGACELSIEQIKQYNTIVLKDLPLDEDVVPGQIRNYPVRIASYRGAPAEDIEYLLEKYIVWLNKEFVFPADQKMIYGILKAIMAHLYFVWIHPFGDGNGRTARLIEFQIMLSSGIPSVAAHLLSNHYNITRTKYYQILDRTSKSEDFITDFIDYALEGLVDGLKEEIEVIQGKQLQVHWINHIHNRFKGMNSKTDNRKKELILELSTSARIHFIFEEIRHVTPKIAETYANLNDITLKRDLSELIELELLTKDRNDYSLNLKILTHYLTKVPVRE